MQWVGLPINATGAVALEASLGWVQANSLKGERALRGRRIAGNLNGLNDRRTRRLPVRGVTSVRWSDIGQYGGCYFRIEIRHDLNQHIQKAFVIIEKIIGN